MALIKIKDFYPEYQELFDDRDFKGYGVFAGGTDEKIGSVHDLLVDESGKLRYFVVDTGFWIFGKKVLLPVGLARLDHKLERVYAFGLASKEQAETLPEYHENTLIDYDYEERVRQTYRSPESKSIVPVNRENYHYDRDRDLYDLTHKDREDLKLYEERLVAHKERHKVGDVTIGKRVETERAKTSVPVERERVIIERTAPTTEEALSPEVASFQAGEIARMEVYEETAEIRKEAFVREEVHIEKQVERDTITAEDELRHEELDIKANDKTIIERH